MPGNSAHLLSVAVFAALLLCANGHTAQEWKSRTIYQILTDRFGSSSSNQCGDLSNYCGGSYKEAAAKLDYIKGMGFDAIWISPIVLNTDGGYHGYWLKDLNAVNPNFGQEEDLLSFVKQAHSKGMWVMVDIVANHVGNVDTDFGQVSPFNQAEHYHSKCEIEDFTDQPEVEKCRLANLPDLDQDNQFVRSTLLQWISQLKSKYGFDGIRIDTVPEVHPDFWSDANQAAGMYCIGEVFDGRLDYVSSYQQHLDGVLDYPMYFAMRNVFGQQQPMQAFEQLIGPQGSMRTSFKDINLLGSFIDNHDNNRFLHDQNDMSLYRNAIAMTLFMEGIPIVYYGTEQSYSGGADPNNRESLWPNYNTNAELYTFIAALNKVRQRQKVWANDMVQRYSAKDFYAFTRGETLVALSNIGSGNSVSYKVTYLPTSWKTGDRVCDAVNTETCFTLNDTGLDLFLDNGMPLVLTKQ